MFVEVRRFRTEATAVTTTDTVAVRWDPGGDADARVLEAQRVEVAGAVTDPRDPDAAAPALQVRGDTISGQVVFGPGGGGPTGLRQRGALALRCPDR